MEDQTGHRLMPIGFAESRNPRQVLRNGKGFFTNNPAAHPDSIGCLKVIHP